MVKVRRGTEAGDAPDRQGATSENLALASTPNDASISWTLEQASRQVRFESLLTDDHDGRGVVFPPGSSAMLVGCGEQAVQYLFRGLALVRVDDAQ